MSCRKNQASLTVQEKQAFVNAVLKLKNNTPSKMGLTNRYDDYVMTHMNSMMLMNGQTRSPGWAHRAPAFFAWHRVMLRQFELDLQAIDPTVALPYWDWTVDNSPSSSIWDVGFMGGNGRAGDRRVMDGPFAFGGGQWTLNVREPGDNRTDLQRDFTANASALPTGPQVSDCINNETPFDAVPWSLGAQPSFRDRAEGWHGLGSIHNRVHLWVGGSMLPSTSPNDPVFFLHHCNIDRLLTLWQRQHPLEGYHPTGMGGESGPLGHNLNDTLLFNDQNAPPPFTTAFPVAGTWSHHGVGYSYDTDPPEVNLLTPSLSFTDIPEGIGASGVTTYRAVVFEILSCAPVTLQITAGPTAPFSAPLGLSALVTPSTFDAPTHGRLWIAYTSTTAGASVAGSVTVHVVETGQSWVINIAANTVARPKSAVALVLDHSGSMSDDAGDGHTKTEKLKEAVQAFTDVMLPGDGLSIVRFDDTVQRLMNVTDVGPVSPVTPGSGRDLAQQIVNGNQLDPAGATSIGGGVAEGRNALNTAPPTNPPYSVKAMVVLTDGMENTPPMIADVLGSINANTYAIGFGTPANISVAALNQLTQNTNGYLVVTGTITPDIRFRLIKYFLQILAGITNANVVLDPQGELILGAKHRIPFAMSEADMGMDVILLCPAPYYVDFLLETPGGDIIDPARALAEPALQFYSRGTLSYYRSSLPALVGRPAASHRGRWHAILSLSRKAQSGGNELAARLPARALPYSLLVHGYSNLQFKASVYQQSYQPGAAVRISASLVEYEVAVEQRALVRAEVTRPNGGITTLTLAEYESGHFQASFTADQLGVYVIRVRASGTTFYGTPFQREQTLTVTTALGGDRDPAQDGLLHWLKDRDRRLCRLLECLMKEGLHELRVREWAKEAGINLEAIMHCLKTYCCREDHIPREGVTHLATPQVGAAPLRIEHVIAALRAAEAAPGFAELLEGKPVDRSVHGEEMMGPMFDFSPEDKAAGAAGGKHHGGNSVPPPKGSTPPKRR